MKTLLSILNQLPEFSELRTDLDNGRCPIAVGGLSAVHRAHFAAALHRQEERPLVMVCADENEAKRMARDLESLSGEKVELLPGREFTFHNAATVSRQWEHQRLGVLRRLNTGRAGLVVATIEGLVQRTMPPETLAGASLILKPGNEYDLEQVALRLSSMGYTRCEQVEGHGQFAIRGDILDVYAPAMELPVRAEFFGDELDIMSTFDLVTQRRTDPVEEVELLPAAETLAQLAPGGVLGLMGDIEKTCLRAIRKKCPPELVKHMEEDSKRLEALTSFPAMDRYLDLIYPKMATALDYIPLDGILCFSESSRVAESFKNYLWRMNEDMEALFQSGILWGELARFTLEGEEFSKALREFPVVYLDSFIISNYPLSPRDTIQVMAKQLPSFGASLETAVSDLRHYTGGKSAAVVLCVSELRAQSLQEMMREQGISMGMDYQLKELPRPGTCVAALGGLSAGMEYPGLGLAILTEGQVSPAAKRKGKSKSVTNRQKLDTYTDLKPGDLVVHEHHGIGRFLEMTRMTVDGVVKDYIKIAYAGTDALYVPATQLDLVSKYIGAGEDGAPAKLSKLGGADWQRAKTKTRKAVQDLAKGLIQLYAQRQRQVGYAFHPDDPWQREFEDRFEYQETDDQLRCIQEIKEDMERPIPMDRLLCGDVGYGKTEVALRAVMKCVLEGKQAAILVPTTVLAQQHYQTALSRFAHYPVRIGMVSRFRTAKQIKQTLAELEAGQLDILVGTHRLFQKDVKFKDLGLLVIDEEQRFGVAHKERLKELAKQVDCLTLSATPIPRTLNMALSGIRDMSTIEEPPQDRQPVLTYVLEQDWSVLADAMRREIGRGGQVYYLHNRVDTISRTAARIRELLGEDVQVGIGHGKMSEEELSDVMQRMVEGELQVLVCTTIIETGIDIPNVNTLIIEDADKMGLAQLHQLRGRVGRSSRRAFAYLTYRKGKVLSEIATKRLSTIREFAEFGSGFKIAMRDLEIRGAGNLLGPEQSGFLVSVGYDLYLKLLEEAVLEERGEPIPKVKECSADLTVSANIPEFYVPASDQRMDLYRRIARIRSEADADDLVDELIDRYGEPPTSVSNLVTVALLRATALRCGIHEITQRGSMIRFGLGEFQVEPVFALAALPEYKGRVLVKGDKEPVLTLKVRPGENVLRLGQKFLTIYETKLKELGQTGGE